MGAKHCTPAEIKEFVKLYEKYGTYAAVAKEAKRSVGAVSKHIKLYYAANLAQVTTTEAAAPQEQEVKQIVINLK